jgi:hypothetical protein
MQIAGIAVAIEKYEKSDENKRLRGQEQGKLDRKRKIFTKFVMGAIDFKFIGILYTLKFKTNCQRQLAQSVFLANIRRSHSRPHRQTPRVHCCECLLRPRFGRSFRILLPAPAEPDSPQLVERSASIGEFPNGCPAWSCPSPIGKQPLFLPQSLASDHLL